MKHFNKILSVVAAIAVIGCSSEKYHQFTKVRVNKTPKSAIARQIEKSTVNENALATKNIENAGFIKSNEPQASDQTKPLAERENMAKTEVVTAGGSELASFPKPYEVDNTKKDEAKSKIEAKYNVKKTAPSAKMGSGGINAFALVGFISGIVGLLVLPILFGLVAIVFSAIGWSQISKGNGSGKGFAIAGLVLGILEVLVLFLVIAVLLAAA